MNIVYSYNKTGYEAAMWDKEIRAASYGHVTFIPFNHGLLLDPNLYLDAWQLDRLYRSRHPGLMRMYAMLDDCLREHHADALLVTNCPPYHPDYLRTLHVYCVLYSTDDPDSTYRRTIPYLHAYQHVLFCSPSYSPLMDLQAKMHDCGMQNADWLPLGVFDFERASQKSEAQLLEGQRDIDVIYVGGFWRQKIATLIATRKALGRRFHLYGYFRWRHNLYINLRYAYGAWVRSVSFQRRVQLYQRSKIGINLHWNEYGLGNQRLYHLPANGALQLCDCAAALGRIFAAGSEVVPYTSTFELLCQLRYYLDHDDERRTIARQGYQRVMRDYLFSSVARRAADLISQGMARSELKRWN